MTIANDVVALIALMLISTFFYCFLVLAIDSTRHHTSQQAYGAFFDAWVHLMYVFFLRPCWLPLRALCTSIARFFVSLRNATRQHKAQPATPAQAQPATRQQPIIVHLHNYVPGTTPAQATATPAPNQPLTVDTILHGPLPSVLAPDQDTCALDESDFLPLPDESAPAQAPATHKRANGTRAN